MFTRQVNGVNHLNYIREGGVLSFFFFFFSLAVTLEKHACTRQPHYMLFGCLMRAGWKMENVPSVVCLMAGFLSSNHTAGVPGWSRQHPSAGHCGEKTHFFNLHHHHVPPVSLQPLPAQHPPSAGITHIRRRSLAHAWMSGSSSWLFITY